MCDSRTHACLRQLANEHGWTPARLVREAGFASSSLYAWLGGRSMSDDAVNALAATLGCSPDRVRHANTASKCDVTSPPAQHGPYGRLVLDAAAARGLSIERVAALAGVGRASLYDSVGGKRRPRSHQVAAVAGVLGLDAAELGRLAGQIVDGPADVARLEAGESRRRYARRHGVSVEHAFGIAVPALPPTAWRTAVARGELSCAPAAMARCRRRSNVGAVGAAVLSVCDERGWSIAAFASHVGVGRSSVERWITGSACPRGTNRVRLEATLGVSLDALAVVP